METQGRRRRWACDAGAISPMMLALLAPLLGLMGLATEASGWFLTQTRLQGAADAAVLAAALNGCDQGAPCHTRDGWASVQDEARAVAARYGFADGVSGVVVTADGSAACPDGGADCYRVTISTPSPFFLLAAVGFRGEALADGGVHDERIMARAVATPGTESGSTAPDGGDTRPRLVR